MASCWCARVARSWGRSSRAPASTRRESLPPARPLPHAAALSPGCPGRRAVAGQRCPEARHSRALACDVCRVGTRHDRCAGRPPCTCLLRRQRDQEGRGAAREDDHRPAVHRGGLDLEAARRACAPDRGERPGRGPVHQVRAALLAVPLQGPVSGRAAPDASPGHTAPPGAARGWRRIADGPAVAALPVAGWSAVAVLVRGPCFPPISPSVLRVRGCDAIAAPASGRAHAGRLLLDYHDERPGTSGPPRLVPDEDGRGTGPGHDQHVAGRAAGAARVPAPRGELADQSRPARGQPAGRLRHLGRRQRDHPRDNSPSSPPLAPPASSCPPEPAQTPPGASA